MEMLYSLILFISGAVTFFIINRLLKDKNSETVQISSPQFVESNPDIHKEEVEEIINCEVYRPKVDLLPLSILKNISFDDVSNIKRMSKRMGEEQVVLLNQQFQIFNLSLKLVDAYQLRGIEFAKFAEKVQTAIKHGSAGLQKTKDGHELLIATSKETGKILGNSRKVSKTLHNISELSNLVVNAAHIISSYDNAMKLKSIDKKIDSLLRFREMDMVSEFKATYEELQCLIHSSENEEEDEARQRLRQIQNKFRVMRIKWLSEVRDGLNSNVEDPKDTGTLKKIFFGKEKITEETTDQVYKCLAPLYLVRSIIELERLTSIALLEEEQFEHYSINNTITELNSIRELLVEKKDSLNKFLQDGGKQVTAMIEESDSVILSLKKAESEKQVTTMIEESEFVALVLKKEA